MARAVLPPQRPWRSLRATYSALLGEPAAWAIDNEGEESYTRGDITFNLVSGSIHRCFVVGWFLGSRTAFRHDA